MNDKQKISGLLETLLITLSATGLWYYCYYLLAPWIWRQNIHFRPEDLTPLILKAVDQDGFEIYALYILVFVIILSALILSELVGRIKGKQIRRILLACTVFASAIFCSAISFIPPMNSFDYAQLSSITSENVRIMLICFPLIAILVFIQRRSTRFLLIIVGLLLIPVCFIATDGISQIDYYFIFAPALRLLSGAGISDIYFQYDLLPSLLAVGWMKLGLEMNTFQILGQTGYYSAILCLFIFSGKLFHKKGLSIFLLVALVLGRLYASPWEVNQCFQVTPFRLDLWIPLLLVVYRWGPYHWSGGLACGLLLLLLKNFGIIYSLAYIQLLITLFAINYMDDERKGSFIYNLAEYGKRCAVPVLMLLFSGIISYFLFLNKEYGNYATYYQKIGIGFMKIATTSFYWYVPAILSTVVILLFKLRKNLPSRYVTTGFFLTYCTIGNSIYFFGRSHEHNILNIAIILLFLFFYMLDLVSRYLSMVEEGTPLISFLRRTCVVFIASLTIIVISVFYSGHILRKVSRQIAYAEHGQSIVHYTFYLRDDHVAYMNHLRSLTNYSPKVYFIDEFDFLYYYYGGYEPVGFCSPFMTWIFKKDQKRYLQGLLDNGYYLIASDRLKYVLDDLHYIYYERIGANFIVSKQNILSGKP